MNTESKFDKIMPLLDRYMLAKLKMQQMIVKHNKVTVELAEEVGNAHDLLTEEWFAINPDAIKIIS